MGIKIIDVKVIASCKKHRHPNQEMPKDKNGRPYDDTEIECLECNLRI